jgi:hypothetical protein
MAETRMVAKTQTAVETRTVVGAPGAVAGEPVGAGSAAVDDSAAAGCRSPPRVDDVLDLPVRHQHRRREKRGE